MSECLITGRVEMVEDERDSCRVATSLCRLLFETVKVNDALLFMTILSTDLKALKRRGYNGASPNFLAVSMRQFTIPVDKILRQHQNERKLVEETRSQALKPISVPDPRMSRNLGHETPPHQAVVPGSWDPPPSKAIASKPLSPPAPAPPSVPSPPVQPPESSTSNAPSQRTANDEDIGRRPIIPNLNNTLQNIRRKIPGFTGLSEDAHTPSREPPSTPR